MKAGAIMFYSRLGVASWRGRTREIPCRRPHIFCGPTGSVRRCAECGDVGTNDGSRLVFLNPHGGAGGVCVVLTVGCSVMKSVVSSEPTPIPAWYVSS